MSRKVYALHQPCRYDHRKRTMVPLDIDMAKSFGELKMVFPGTDRPPPITNCGVQLAAAMADFKSEDLLLLVGDMDLLAFAAVLASKATGGKLTFLKWHKRDRCYYEVSAPAGLLN